MDRSHPSRSTTTGTSIPVWIGLRAIAEELPRSRDRREFHRLAQYIENGGDLQSYPTPPQLIPLVETLKSGEDSGQVAEMLADYLQADQDIQTMWRSFWASLVYPFSLLMIAVLVLGVFLVYSSGTFDSLFEEYGVETPLFTLALLQIAGFLTLYWFFMLKLISVIMVPLAVLLFTGGSLVGGIRGLQSVPLIGSAARAANAAEFCSRLALFVDARIPLPKALESLSRALTSRSMREVSGRLVQQIQQGVPTGVAAENERLLPPQIQVILGQQETPGVMSDSLRMQAQLLSIQAQLRIAQVRFLIQPFVFFFLAMGTASIALGFFLPLIKLLNDLS